MKISPVLEESNLLYALAESPTYAFGESPMVIIAQPATVQPLSFFSLVPWISFFISLVTLLLVFINKFKLKQKIKKDVSLVEEQKLKHKKRRKIYLNICNICMLVLYASIMSNYLEKSDLYEILEWLYMIISSYLIITIVQNKIKYKKCKDEEKEKYFKLAEKSSIMLPIITFVILIFMLILEIFG